jgi:hypothetical protein
MHHRLTSGIINIIFAHQVLSSDSFRSEPTMFCERQISASGSSNWIHIYRLLSFVRASYGSQLLVLPSFYPRIVHPRPFTRKSNRRFLFSTFLIMDAASQLKALLCDTAAVSFANPVEGVARPTSPGRSDPLVRVGGTRWSWNDSGSRNSRYEVFAY